MRRSTVAGYLIVELDYDDASWVEAYNRDVPPLLDAYGGRYLVRSTRAELMEGTPGPRFITALLEFPTAADARTFLHSDVYQPYAESRRAAGRTRMLLLEGR